MWKHIQDGRGLSLGCEFYFLLFEMNMFHLLQDLFRVRLSSRTMSSFFSPLGHPSSSRLFSRMDGGANSIPRLPFPRSSHFLALNILLFFQVTLVLPLVQLYKVCEHFFCSIHPCKQLLIPQTIVLSAVRGEGILMSLVLPLVLRKAVWGQQCMEFWTEINLLEKFQLKSTVYTV